jgi:outer membrane protein assembly factor BamB
MRHCRCIRAALVLAAIAAGSAFGGTLNVNSTPDSVTIVGVPAAVGGTTPYQRTGLSGTIRLTAPTTSPSGAVFSKWHNDALGDFPDPVISFTMNQDWTWTAVYTPSYTLSVNSTPEGVSIEGVPAAVGGTTPYQRTGLSGTIRLTAPTTSPSGAVFSRWHNDALGDFPDPVISFTMNQDWSWTAIYIRTYTLSVNSTPESVTIDGVPAAVGGATPYQRSGLSETIRLTAPSTSPSGAVFSKWHNDALGDFPDPVISFTMNQDWSWTAVYIPTYTLSVDSTPENVTIDGVPTAVGGTTPYLRSGLSETIRLTAPSTSPSGAVFSKWHNDALGDFPDPVISFTMNQDWSWTAMYVAQYSLTTEVSGGHGTLMPPSSTYAAGTVVALTAASDTGYRVRAWTGTDDDTKTTTTNTVTMNAARVVTVSFEEIPAEVCCGDANCDGAVNWRDIDPFIAGMNDNQSAWRALFPAPGPGCPFANLDANNDGHVNWRDIDPFIARMNTMCGTPPGSLNWAFAATGEIGGPALGPDGTIYFGTQSGEAAHLYAVSPAGVELWKQPLEGIYGNVSVGPDGTVYAGASYMGQLRAFRPDGSVKWAFQMEGSVVTTAPAFAADGTIYVRDNNSQKLIALDPNGTKLWEYPPPGGPPVGTGHATPVVGVDGTIYIGSGSAAPGGLLAIRPNGTLKWYFETGNPVHSTPAIDADGTIYFGAANNALFYAVDPNGTERWHYALGGDCNWSAAIGADGTIYAGSYANRLYAFTRSGEKKWEFVADGPVTFVSIGADGTVFASSCDRNIYALDPAALDPNGQPTLKWLLPTLGAFEPCAYQHLLAPDGTLYVASDDHHLYAINTGCGGLGDTPWAKAYHDNQNTGRAHAGPYWSELSGTLPSARMLPGMCYDSFRGRTVLFGGWNPVTGGCGDTWEFDGSTWAQVASSGPSARWGHALAYDAGRHRAVLFGGTGGGADTWEWDGATWVQAAVTGPSWRDGIQNSMVYDRTRGVVVLFGGCVGGYSRETWEWNGSNWSLKATDGPPASYVNGMAYDEARQVTVLFGGWQGSSAIGETWLWDGTVWTLASTTGPSARDGSAMIYDDYAGRVVLFAGEDGPQQRDYADTWVWDGACWTQLAASGPASRFYHNMAYDSARREVVLFGGKTWSDGTILGDAWTFGAGVLP